MGLIDDVYLIFGKYKGESISNTPSSYLKWCLEQDFLEDNYEDLVELFEQELNWRSQMDMHFEDKEDIRYQ